MLTSQKYTEGISLSSEDPRYLLIIGAFEFRQKELSLKLNIAGTLLCYQNEYYQPPLISKSTGQGQDRSQHAERLSLTLAIKSAINDGWGPFKNFKTKLPVTFTLSSEVLKDYPELKNALTKLDSILIFSERMPCDYRKNPTDTNRDKGCTVYFENLEKLMFSGKIKVYYCMLRISDIKAQEELRKQLDLLFRHKDLITKKEKIRLQKNAVKKRYIEQFNQHQVKTSSSSTQNSSLEELQKQKDEELEKLSKEEENINKELKSIFNLPKSAQSTQTITSTTYQTPLSQIHQTSAVNIQRKALKNVNIAEFIHNSDAITLGEAIDGGDCFFDALAQIVNAMHKNNQYDVKSLRVLCHKYYQEHKKEVDEWNRRDQKTPLKENQYDMVQFTKREMDKDHAGKPPTWGRAHIEGRILCQVLDLKAFIVIELLQTAESNNLIPSYKKITSNGEQSINEDEAKKLIASEKFPTLVVSQNQLHFVPLLAKETPTHTPLKNPGFVPIQETQNSSSLSKNLSVLSKQLTEQKIAGEELSQANPTNINYTKPHTAETTKRKEREESQNLEESKEVNNTTSESSGIFSLKKKKPNRDKD